MAFLGDYTAVIVGAAFSGLGMAARLTRSGITNFVVLEKDSDLGGIWRDNTYPGCSCDVPQQLYSYSFRPARDPAVRYPGQPDILDYLHRVADAEHLTSHLRFGAEVIDATYHDSGRWTITIAAGDRYTAQHLIWAVGQLHRPYIPDIPGRNTFQGNIFHSARWDHHHDLTDRTIAVIGTGASAVQFVPEIAPTARRIRVHQRTPQWILPRPPEHFGAARRAVFTRSPALQNAYRAAVFVGADLTLTPIMTRGWTARPATWLARRHLHRHVNDPALRARLTPDYPIGGKRILLSNSWYAALQRDNVDLITAPIQRLTPTGIETTAGHTSADTVIWATGFRATEFLAPARIHGRDGVDLHDTWADGATALLGVALPRFPNMYMLAGPGSFIGHGSNPFVHECQARMILNALRWCARTGSAAIEVRPSAMADYSAWREEALARTVWPEAHSWYRTASGRVVLPWPGSATQFARRARTHPARVFETSPTRPGSSRFAATGRASDAVPHTWSWAAQTSS